jgi:hypothetical protein
LTQHLFHKHSDLPTKEVPKSNMQQWDSTCTVRRALAL